MVLQRTWDTARHRRQDWEWCDLPPIALRACYAMSGTDTAYLLRHVRYAHSGRCYRIAGAAVSLRACYAMSGTDIPHAASCLRSRYALS
eukprot:1903442-Rhodomonas_salina.2